MTNEIEYVRAHVRSRERLVRHFKGPQFADPALMILMHLFLAHESGQRLSVKQTCVLAGVPATTALRWISSLEKEGMLRREDDAKDRRIVIVSITDAGYGSVKAWAADVMPKALAG